MTRPASAPRRSVTIDDQSVKASVIVQNRLGLHARPVTDFVRRAMSFESDIVVRRDTVEVNGKSMLLMMTLAATCGTELEIEAKGPDAEAAIAELVEFVERGFDEE